MHANGKAEGPEAWYGYHQESPFQGSKRRDVTGDVTAMDDALQI